MSITAGWAWSCGAACVRRAGRGGSGLLVVHCSAEVWLPRHMIDRRLKTVSAPSFRGTWSAGRKKHRQPNPVHINHQLRPGMGMARHGSLYRSLGRTPPPRTPFPPHVDKWPECRGSRSLHFSGSERVARPRGGLERGDIPRGPISLYPCAAIKSGRITFQRLDPWRPYWIELRIGCFAAGSHYSDGEV